jgi:hypothetical protein
MTPENVDKTKQYSQINIQALVVLNDDSSFLSIKIDMYINRSWVRYISY